MAFVVYKSSAGSGKTATLVLEYLKLCLKNPNDFKRTLAITFTNKAAGEMKSRIIDTLVLISNAEENFITEKLKEHLEIKDDEFQKRGKELLSLITHNYDEFSVSTIDSFVHKIIRTFTNELHLPSNFEIILDKDDLIPEILDNLYRKIGHDKQLTDILVSFVFKQIEEEKTHNISIMLSEFVNYNLSEDVFAQKKFLNSLDINDFIEIIKLLKKKQKQLKENIQQYAKQAINLFSTVSLSADDISYKEKGIYGYFKKLQDISEANEILPGKRNIDIVENDKWVSKKANQVAISAIDGIKVRLTDLFNKIIEDVPTYILLNFIYSKIYSVALTTVIQSLFGEFVNRSAKVHISEFNKKISDSIADQPIPFLYERLGFKYKNFLIDEFQDTSILQWNNLLPLIDESLAYSRFNMLVGDAKQAIYRFRNGEVELFSSLPKLYGSDNSPLSVQRENQLIQAFREIPLDQNWRSHPEIIHFNNELFTFLKNKHSEFIQHIYHDLEQQVPKNGKTDGLIDIEFMEVEDKEMPFQKRQEKILRILDDLLQKNYQPGDIGILCRTKEAVKEHAAFLMERGYAVLSEESLLVVNAPEVQAMAAFFQLIVNPSNTIAQTVLLENIRKINSPDADPDTYYRSFLSQKHNSIHSILSLFGVSAQHEKLEQQPLTEIADFVLREILKVEKASVFVQYYFEFLQQAPQTPDELNRLWEEKKGSYFIATPENTNAIQVMTVHKSKGLAFEVVIVDADTSQVKRTRMTYWDASGLPEPNNLQVALFPLTNALSLINRQGVADKEDERSALDYLNILYVAFTRPIKALYVLPRKINDKKYGVLGTWLMDFLKQKDVFDENKVHYTIGQLPDREKITPRQHTEYLLDKWPSFSWKEHITVAKPEESAGATLFAKTERDYGNLVHMLLAQVGTTEDIEPLLKKQVLTGMLTQEEAAFLGSGMRQIVAHPQLAAYFQPGTKYKNETEILLDTMEIIRPDRVVKTPDHLAVIDYKTGEIDPKHEKQIIRYRNAIQSMGYARVKAMLVYLRDEVTVVELT